jgi:uncharacterized protein YggE
MSFDPRDDADLLASARAAAFADAKTKATQYASAAGRNLGPVTRIDETVNNTTPMPMMGDRAPAAAGMSTPAVPIDPGTSKLSVNVTVVFGLA